MTPVLDFMLRHSATISRAWNPDLSGIPSFRSFLAGIADAAVYHIPEAETDTTAAAEAFPEHYSTNANVRMPWHSVWIEHKAYERGVGYCGDSALLLRLRPKDQLLVCYAVSVVRAPQPLFLSPLLVFAMPVSDLGNPDTGNGKEYQLRVSVHADGAKAAKVCDFARELLAYIHQPTGVVETVIQPEEFDQRALRRLLGPSASFAPYRVLRTAGDVVSKTSVVDRAAAAMGTISEAVN